MIELHDQQTRGVLADAGHAIAALDAVVNGQAGDVQVPTDVSSLADIRTVIVGLAADLRRVGGERDRLRARLMRIANLELRGARDLIEARNWKRIADEMQAIADGALQRG